MRSLRAPRQVGVRDVDFFSFFLPLMINSSGKRSSKHHMVSAQRWTIDFWNTKGPVSHSASSSSSRERKEEEEEKLKCVVYSIGAAA